MNKRPKLSLPKARTKQDKTERQRAHNRRTRAEKTAANLRRRDINQNVNKVLWQHFPALFNWEKPKPIMRSVQKAVIAHMNDLPGDLTPTQIRQGINYYCRRKEYYLSYLDHTHRYDLEGHPVEEITNKQREFATTQIKILEKYT